MNSYRWYLSDLKEVEQNGLKVFNTFSCGGGFSMGYKLAGYNLLGNCEIDPQMMKIYRKNHNPKYSFLMDITICQRNYSIRYLRWIPVMQRIFNCRRS